MCFFIVYAWCAQTPELIAYELTNKQDHSGLYSISIDTDLLEQAPPYLTLPLPDGSTVTANRETAHVHDRKSYSWIGHTSQGRLPVFFATSNGKTSALIYGTDQLYAIRSTVEGHVLEQVYQDEYPGCRAVVPPKSVPKVQEHSQTDFTQDRSWIDVFMVYTDTAEQEAGGPDGMTALIRNAIDIANYAFRQSQVSTRLRLVHQQVIDYVESTDIGNDLAWLQSDANMQALRRQYRADLLGMVIEGTGNSCGIAYTQSQVDHGFAPFAVHVTVRQCTVANLSFAHEIGHNMGCEHDPANAMAGRSNASYPWSFGHYVDGHFRTIMSYGGECTLGCRRMPCYSNADVLLDEFQTGIRDRRENYRTINQTSPRIADYY